MDHRPSDNGNNFIAVFRLKRHLRENSSVAPSIQQPSEYGEQRNQNNDNGRTVSQKETPEKYR